MGKTNFAKFFKNVQTTLSKHSPEILTGIGIAGMVTTTVLAVSATPKALRLIEEKKNELCTDDLTPVEVVQASWKCYIPAAVTGVTSIACLIGASSVSLKRNTALATAYKLSETALTEYREKVVETIGEKKEKAVREKVTKEQLRNTPTNGTEIVIPDNGDSQCFDPLSGRYFHSSREKIKKAENELNSRMLHDIFGYASLNEFYDEIGLGRADVGDVMGWNAENLINIEFDSHIADNGKPTIVLDYSLSRPDYGYETW